MFCVKLKHQYALNVAKNNTRSGDCTLVYETLSPFVLSPSPSCLAGINPLQEWSVVRMMGMHQTLSRDPFPTLISRTSDGDFTWIKRHFLDETDRVNLIGSFFSIRFPVNITISSQVFSVEYFLFLFILNDEYFFRSKD